MGLRVDVYVSIRVSQYITTFVTFHGMYDLMIN